MIPIQVHSSQSCHVTRWNHHKQVSKDKIKKENEKLPSKIHSHVRCWKVNEIPCSPNARGVRRASNKKNEADTGKEKKNPIIVKTHLYVPIVPATHVIVVKSRSFSKDQHACPPETQFPSVSSHPVVHILGARRLSFIGSSHSSSVALLVSSTRFRTSSSSLSWSVRRRGSRAQTPLARLRWSLRSIQGTCKPQSSCGHPRPCVDGRISLSIYCAYEVVEDFHVPGPA